MDTTKHLSTDRLLEVAEKNIRFTQAEVGHIEQCPACLDAYAKLILQAARLRAQKTTNREKSTS